ncbi:MAG: hypothetical protein AB7O45_08205 [Alphaproteobacteria bacterium]
MAEHEHLLDIFLSNTEPLSTPQLDWLERCGWPRRLAWRWPGPVVRGGIEVDPETGLFLFDPRAAAVLIWPARETFCGDLIDIIALSPRDPSLWWSHEGRADPGLLLAHLLAWRVAA